MLRTIALLLAAAALLPAREVVTVKGSDTMVILVQRWAELYMKKDADITVQVTGGGTGTGVSALINGSTDIAMASRPLKAAERAKLKKRNGSGGVEIRVARDAVSVFVNAKNPVQELTLDQLRRIYLGEVRRWSEVGGADAPIILYSRENNSGTYVFFKDEVLGGRDFAAGALNMPGTASVVHAVAKDPNGIGFGGAAYAKNVRIVKMKKDAASPAVLPTESAVSAGTYPVSRSLYLYLTQRPSGAVKRFVDWLLGAEGQKVVSAVGYFPLR